MKKNYSCPNCNYLLHSREKNVIIGSPMIKCPRCRNDIIDTAFMEWISLSFILKTWAFIYQAFYVVIVIVMIIGIPQYLFSFELSLLTTQIIAIILFVPSYIFLIIKTLKTIKESKIRTSNKAYLDQYKSYGYRVPRRIYRKAK